MPAALCKNNNLFIRNVAFVYHFNRLVVNQPFLLLTAFVLVIKLNGELLRLQRVICKEKINRCHRVRHSACGIKARRNRITHNRAVIPLRLYSERGNHGSQPDIRIFRQLIDTCGGYNPVFIAQGHNIGNRSERNKIGISFKNFTFGLAAYRAHKLKRNSHTGKIFKRVFAVGSFRIDYSGSLGQLVLALMMIGYYHIESETFCILGFRHSSYSCVNAYHQRCAAVLYFLNGSHIYPVPLVLTVGNICRRFNPARTQIAYQKRG